MHIEKRVHKDARPRRNSIQVDNLISSTAHLDMRPRKDSINCALIGDGLVGKTSIAKSFTERSKDDNHRYVSTVFHNYIGSSELAGKEYTINVLDSSGEV